MSNIYEQLDELQEQLQHYALIELKSIITQDVVK